MYQLDLVEELRARLAHVHHGLVIAGHVLAFPPVCPAEFHPHPRTVLRRNALLQWRRAIQQVRSHMWQCVSGVWGLQNAPRSCRDASGLAASAVYAVACNCLPRLWPR